MRFAPSSGDLLEWRRRCARVTVVSMGVGCLAGLNCLPAGVDPFPTGIYNNTTDFSNGGADYITSRACAACHPGLFEINRLHGHANALTAVLGEPPAFPPEAVGAGAADPPPSTTWGDVSYVVGGYAKGALFLNTDGFILTTGATGGPTQWNLANAVNGSPAEFVPFGPGEPAQPFEFDALRRRTTGPMEQDPMMPLSQENRPGIRGTWIEPGAQCESCHGPGSLHAPNPAARNLFVDSPGEQTCRRCHGGPAGTPDGTIPAADGFIRPLSQWAELKASGGHSQFACTFCHDPHRSVYDDRTEAIRNECTACHGDMNMALHGGKTFTRPSDGYTEVLTCESCHMPYAVRQASAASAAVVGPLARVGDTRSHVFRITTEPIDTSSFFTPDGTGVVSDSDGRAALTVDFVCLRCHNDESLPNLSFDVDRASEIAIGVHQPFGN
jgi:hypothetical protein